jgi:hypothetical protein
MVRAMTLNPSQEHHLSPGTRLARSRLARRLGQALAVAALLAGGSVAGAAPSSASPSCHYPLCSSIANRSQQIVFVAHDWCGDSQRLTQNAPPCGYKSTDYWLNPGGGTPSHEDWDTFRVDEGWCYHIRTWHKIGYNSFETINRIGQSKGVWVRVHNDQIAFITSQSTSGC